MLVLGREGCTPCLRVTRLLGEIARERPGLTIREVLMDSEEGIALALENGILVPPAVFLDGSLWAKGKIREEDLRRALGAPSAPGVP